MADAVSNSADLLDHLARLVHAFDLDAPDMVDSSKSLGDSLLDIAAEGVRARAVDGQKSPDGTPFDPLTESYAIRKRRTWGFITPIGVASGEMLSMEQLRGERAIDQTEAASTYGIDQANRDKLDGFEQLRPVYGLNDDSVAAIRDRLAEHLHAWLES